jgi:hypothetical protein
VCVAHGPVYILVTLSLERIEFQKFPNLPQLALLLFLYSNFSHETYYRHKNKEALQMASLLL